MGAEGRAWRLLRGKGMAWQLLLMELLNPFNLLVFSGFLVSEK